MDARRRAQKQIREQAHHGNQVDPHRTQATADPAQGRGQGDIIGAQRMGGGLQTGAVSTTATTSSICANVPGKRAAR